MTGYSVNEAPVLERVNVGIADVGATDAAFSISSVVVLVALGTNGQHSSFRVK